MAAAKTRATSKPTEAKAAIAETSPNGHKKIEVRGFKFELPGSVPFAVLLAGRTVDRAGDNSAEQTYAMLDLAEAYVGDQITQFNHLSAQDGAEAVVELLEACDARYGTESGESSASQDS